MKRMNLFLAFTVVAGVLTACGPSTPSVDVEGCEHTKEGPAAAVTATAAASGAPAVADDHKRYDVTLIDVTGGKGGRVTFAADEEGDFAFFLNQDVPFKVFDSSDKEVAAETSVKSISACTEVKAKYTVPLKVGTYTLSFGPSTQTSVGVVIEHAAHEHK